MRALVISARTRPHIIDETGSCWCKPTEVECECGNGCGSQYIHKCVDLDDPAYRRPVMSSFSEQRQYD